MELHGWLLSLPPSGVGQVGILVLVLLLALVLQFLSTFTLAWFLYTFTWSWFLYPFTWSWFWFWS